MNVSVSGAVARTTPHGSTIIERPPERMPGACSPTWLAATTNAWPSIARGGTFGSVTTAVERCRKNGLKVAQVHFRYLNPMPKNTADVLKRFKKVLVPELNAGQLVWLLRAKYLAPAEGLNKIQGKPFLVSEIVAAIEKALS